MSRRARLLEIMTAAGLADKDLERERIRAQREAALTGAWVGALGSGVQAATDSAGKAYGALESDALERAKTLIAANAGSVGSIKSGVAPASVPALALTPTGLGAPDKRATGGIAEKLLAKTPAPVAPPVLETPDEAARRIVGASPDFAPLPTENVNPLEWIGAGVMNPLREKAARAAAAGLTAQIAANRKAAEATAYTRDKDAAEFNQKERHFTGGQEFKQREGETQRAFQERMAKAGFAHADEAQGRSIGAAATQGALNRSAAQKRAETAAEAAREKAEKAKPLPMGVIDAIADLDTAKKNADSIMQRAAATPLGTGAVLRNEAAQTFGIDDANITALRADLKALVADYKKAMSGAGVSDKEAADILSTMPNDRDSGESFRVKMQRFQARVQTAIDAKLNAFGAANYDVSGLKRQQAATQPQASQAADLEDF